MQLFWEEESITLVDPFVPNTIIFFLLQRPKGHVAARCPAGRPHLESMDPPHCLQCRFALAVPSCSFACVSPKKGVVHRVPVQKPPRAPMRAAGRVRGCRLHQAACSVQRALRSSSRPSSLVLLLTSTRWPVRSHGHDGTRNNNPAFAAHMRAAAAANQSTSQMLQRRHGRP